MMFPVIGAGYLAIRFNYISHCGTAQGASVDASWSKYGYSGGVMEIEDMIELKKQIETYVNDFGTKEQKTLMNSSS